jgi:hypothetical protein
MKLRTYLIFTMLITFYCNPLGFVKATITYDNRSNFFKPTYDTWVLVKMDNNRNKLFLCLIQNDLLGELFIDPPLSDFLILDDCKGINLIVELQYFQIGLLTCDKNLIDLNNKGDLSKWSKFGIVVFDIKRGFKLYIGLDKSILKHEGFGEFFNFMTGLENVSKLARNKLFNRESFSLIRILLDNEEKDRLNLVLDYFVNGCFNLLCYDIYFEIRKTLTTGNLRTKLWNLKFLIKGLEVSYNADNGIRNKKLK